MAEENERIHVLYALSDKRGTYTKFVGTSILSIINHTEEKLVFHIFHDGSLTSENTERLCEMTHRHNQEIKLYNVRQLKKGLLQQAEDIFKEAMQDVRYTEAMFYRLLAPQILPENVHRLIYLDADTIVNIDIQKLWWEEIGANGLAAVREHTLINHYHANGAILSKEEIFHRMGDVGVSLETCFNSGVLLLDLDKLRQKGDVLLPGLRFLARYPGESKFYDQDILCYFFARDLTPLPWYYNILMHWDKQYGKPEVSEGIYHFMGHTLEMNPGDPRQALFFDTFIQTPWFDGTFFEYSCMTMEKIYELMLLPWMNQARKLFMVTLRRNPVLAATEEALPQLLRLYRNPAAIHDSDKKNEEEENLSPEEAAKFFRSEEIPFVFLGSEKKELALDLHYDLDTSCYLVFAGDVQKVEGSLMLAGLKRDEQFLNTNFLLNGSQWLKSIIQPQRFIETL